MRTLLVDNHDSYTYNLFQLLARTYGVEPIVIANDDEWTRLDVADLDAVVLSPGPGRPQTARDVGCGPALVHAFGLPVLGVCLGHQLLGMLAGATVAAAPRPRHGHLERVNHDGTGLFHGLPRGFTAVRYHSLCVTDPLPADLVVTARSADGVVMALHHRTRPWWGVQFHPESVATEFGPELLENFRALALARLRSVGGARTHDGWRVHVRPVTSRCDAQQVFDDHFADRELSFWLDSSRVESGLSRWSFLGDAGGPCGEVLVAQAGTGRVDVRGPDGATSEETGSIFDVLRARIAERAAAVDAALPFDLAGGYVGYFGYEMKAECGSPNRHLASTADAQWMTASRMVAVDHESDRRWVVAVCDGRPEHCAEARGWVDSTAATLRGGRPAPEAGSPPVATPVVPQDWLDRPRERYLDDIAECRRHLEAGESYEICLTASVDLPFRGSATAVYRRLRRLNPAPYAAYLRFDDVHLLCSSPERFLRVDRERTIESKPIKGTAPRSADRVRDRQLRDVLVSSDKTRAENLMIVDLVRNDIGRVSDVGSVVVPRLMHVESYATVHQLVSTVRGRLRAGLTAIDAVRACFPGGSMSGAPKQRTMEIIERLEHRARGVYSGTIGYFGLNGTADLNIVIRTLVIDGDRLTAGAGGAIVLESDPASEFDEVLVKAAASLRALMPTDVPAPVSR